MPPEGCLTFEALPKCLTIEALPKVQVALSLSNASMHYKSLVSTWRHEGGLGAFDLKLSLCSKVDCVSEPTSAVAGALKAPPG